MVATPMYSDPNRFIWKTPPLHQDFRSFSEDLRLAPVGRVDYIYTVSYQRGGHQRTDLSAPLCAKVHPLDGKDRVSMGRPVL